MRTPSDHAQADLRVENVKISADFIEALNRAEAPLPWETNDIRQVIDASGYLVCDVDGPHGQMIAEMIVLAVNTCGSFRATVREAGE
jgi:hypothetical protein